MCPFCLATAAIIASSATGTSGVALVAGAILKRNKRRILPQEEEVEHGNNSNGSGKPEDGVAR